MSGEIVVSSWARKHRPNQFEDIAGQQQAVSVLKGYIETKSLPSAIMFCGGTGLGKTTLSRMFERYLNCKNGTACGKCKSCVSENRIDLLEVNGSSDRGIDAIKDVISKARFKPHGRVRVIVVDEVHGLTPQAQDAFLKPLEEPAPSTLWILNTTDPQKLKPAVAGRCVILKLNNLSREDLAKYLHGIAKKENLKLDKETFMKVSDSSGGHVRNAVTMLELIYQFVQGNKGMDKEELQNIITEVVFRENIGTVKVATKVMAGLLLGKQKMVLSALGDMDNAIELVNKLLNYNQYLLYNDTPTKHVWASAENRMMKDAVEGVCKKNKVELIGRAHV